MLPPFTGVGQRHFVAAYSYVLAIPAGHLWPYTLSQRNVFNELGMNAGYQVVIEPSDLDPPGASAAVVSDCLPCDFAVANLPDVSRFFPAGCEPCPPDVSIGLPPGCGTSLAVQPARGGCVRPRYFNGMFITREDLESELLYVRLKHRLHNRAAGQGVLWGLDVGRDGGRICVLPGYAVDCCGNDLALTTPYHVEIRTLLCDPAIAWLVASRTPQCASLLLEYVERAESPRPVHGDPCSTQTTRYELSRIRETVRLRLVPPRSPATKGPIADFLKEFEALRSDPKIGPLLEEGIASPPPAAPAPTGPLPFEVHVSVPPNVQVVQPPHDLVAQPSFDRADSQEMVVQVRGNQLGGSVALVARSGFRFTRVGQVVLVRDPSGPVNETPVAVLIQGTGGDRAEWPFRLPHTFAPAARNALTYRLRGWELRPDTGGSPTTGGALDFEVALTFRDQEHNILSLSTTRPVAPPPRSAFPPCFSDPCCADEPRFAVFPPFLHAAFRPGVPADPAVIVLAILYAWFATEVNREESTVSVRLDTPRQRLAASAYLAAWRLLFRVGPDAAAAVDLTGALRRLLAAWCKGLLYPSPKCEGEPHGVVIGYVTIASATSRGSIPGAAGAGWCITRSSSTGAGSSASPRPT